MKSLFSTLVAAFGFLIPTLVVLAFVHQPRTFLVYMVCIFVLSFIWSCVVLGDKQYIQSFISSCRRRYSSVHSAYVEVKQSRNRIYFSLLVGVVVMLAFFQNGDISLVELPMIAAAITVHAIPLLLTFRRFLKATEYANLVWGDSKRKK